MSLWDAATDFFNQASGAIRPREILANYNYLVRQMVYYRKRLKNPVNQRNGKPLAQIFLSKMQRHIGWQSGCLSCVAI
jgi:uncharacterized protein YutD